MTGLCHCIDCVYFHCCVCHEPFVLTSQIIHQHTHLKVLTKSGSESSSSGFFFSSIVITPRICNYFTRKLVERTNLTRKRQNELFREVLIRILAWQQQANLKISLNTIYLIDKSSNRKILKTDKCISLKLIASFCSNDTNMEIKMIHFFLNLVF